MKSMTGYGRSKKSRDAGASEAWVRSVNGRFLEVRVHLPREWLEMEPELRTLASSSVSRGTVDLHINRSKHTSATPNIEVDEKLAKEWLAAYRKLAKVTGLKSDSVPFEMIARAADVVRVSGETDMTAAEKQAVLRVAREALEALEKEKAREGQAIQDELLSLLSQLDNAVARVTKHAADSPDDLRARLKTRLERLEASGYKAPGTDDVRFHQEVALLVDRGDIREEIARLSAHLKVYRELVTAKGPSNKSLSSKSDSKKAKLGQGSNEASAGPIGKTLDFYAQELLREVNTVGSKSQTADLTRIVVEAKTLVEKIREQVQNVE